MVAGGGSASGVRFCSSRLGRTLIHGCTYACRELSLYIRSAACLVTGSEGFCFSNDKRCVLRSNSKSGASVSE